LPVAKLPPGNPASFQVNTRRFNPFLRAEDQGLKGVIHSTDSSPADRF
jgi:hypothetical protein